MDSRVCCWRLLRVALLIGVSMFAPSARATNTVYADAEATAGGNGSSWETAFASVQVALEALQPGGTLYTRGVFFENVRFPFGLDDVTWIGDSDAAKPTWMRGDRRMSDPSLWQVDEMVEGCLSLEGFAAAYGIEGTPDGMVYDFRRDDEAGSVTGIPGIRPWYGHLIRVTSAVACRYVDGSWYFAEDGDRVLINPPGDLADVDPSLITAVVRGENAVLLPGNDGVRISGVNTMLTPTRVGNNGYGFKGTGQDNIVENAVIVDSGWHAAGFAIVDSFRNTLRNITVYGGSVPASFNMNNPFIFYSTLDRLDSENVGEDLTFYAYPILHASGRPMFFDFNPRLGFSHAAPQRVFGGIEWRRCVQIDFVGELEDRHGVQMSWTGSFISGASLPANPTGLPEDAPIRVYDSLAIGPTAKPGHFAYYNTVFDRRGFAQDSGGTVRGGGSMWLIGCVFDVGRFDNDIDSVFAPLGGNARYFFDATTIIASEPGSDGGSFFRFGSTGPEVHLRSSLVHYAGQGTLIRLGPNAWNSAGQIVRAANSVASGLDLPLRHTNPAVAPRDAAWWLANVSGETRFDVVPSFVDVGALDLSPVPGSAIATEFATPIVEELLQSVINGVAYFGRFGHVQTPFDLDINGDGVADAEDLYAASRSDADALVASLRALIAARLRDEEMADVLP